MLGECGVQDVTKHLEQLVENSEKSQCRSKYNTLDSGSSPKTGKTKVYDLKPTLTRSTRSTRNLTACQNKSQHHLGKDSIVQITTK